MANKSNAECMYSERNVVVDNEKDRSATKIQIDKSVTGMSTVTFSF
jgi:hypothetical protein